MGIVLLINLFLFCIDFSFAQDSFFQKSNSECFIQSFENGSLNDVDEKEFFDRALTIKQLPRNPNMVGFKWGDKIYVTPKNCVAEKLVEANRNDEVVVLKERKNFSQDSLVLWSLKKTFIMIDFGKPVISDDSQVSDNYNETFPNTSTNPVTWGKADKSEYSTGRSFSGTLGFRQTASRFLAFKIRSFTGKKIDSLTLTDVNTGLSQEGSWIYEDRFINLYGGFHFQFLPDSYWQPTFSGYLGISRATSTMTDNSETFKLNSIGFALMADVGIERIIFQSLSIGTSIGFEYLGPRNLKFEDNDQAQGFSTKMSYNNINLALGVKYAF